MGVKIVPRGPRVLQKQGETAYRITGPAVPGERELPLLRLLFSIVHDYDTRDRAGEAARDRVSHAELRPHWRRTPSRRRRASPLALLEASGLSLQRRSRLSCRLPLAHVQSV